MFIAPDKLLPMERFTNPKKVAAVEEAGVAVVAGVAVDHRAEAVAEAVDAAEVAVAGVVAGAAEDRGKWSRRGENDKAQEKNILCELYITVFLLLL